MHCQHVMLYCRQLTLMVASARKGKALSALVEEIPARYTASDRLKNFPTDQSKYLLAQWQENLAAMQQALGFKHTIIKVDTTDGLRVTFENGDIVHFRPSGNAPELRCYAEARDEREVLALVADTLEKLRNTTTAKEVI